LAGGSGSSALYFHAGLRARLAIARIDPQPAFVGGHICAGDPPQGRGGKILMQVFCTLVRRELGALFFSWIGYVVIAVVLFLLGLISWDLLDRLNGEAIDQPLTSVFYSTIYFWGILLLAAPVITMRSFALEKSSGTYETLM